MSTIRSCGAGVHRPPPLTEQLVNVVATEVVEVYSAASQNTTGNDDDYAYPTTDDDDSPSATTNNNHNRSHVIASNAAATSLHATTFQRLLCTKWYVPASWYLVHVYVPWYSAALATGLLRLRRVGYHRASVGAAILTQFQRRHLKLHPFCSKTCQPVDGNADGGLLHRVSNWTSTSAARRAGILMAE
jgi:hypothetical protein